MVRILAGLASQVLDIQSKLLSHYQKSIHVMQEPEDFSGFIGSPEASWVSFVDPVLLGSPEVERKFSKSRIAERCPTPQFA
jgi:hypothetical protein